MIAAKTKKRKEDVSMVIPFFQLVCSLRMKKAAWLGQMVLLASEWWKT